MDNTDLVKARLLQIECEMQSMIAENRQRELSGYSMAYGENDFQVLINRIEDLINRK